MDHNQESVRIPPPPALPSSSNEETNKDTID